MKRVYTDERFPGVEVVNFGGTQFLVLEGGQIKDKFTSYEAEGENVSEEYAQRRANDYFNRTAAHSKEPDSALVPADDLPSFPTGMMAESPVARQVVDYLLGDWPH